MTITPKQPTTINRTYLMAALCMIGSAAMFSLMNSFVRLGSETMHTSLIVAWRNILALVILMPLIIRAGKAHFKTKRLQGHVWRGLIGLIGMQLWTYSIASINLNVATALSFTAPLFASLFAVVIFKEHADKYRWAALFAGFTGTVVIIQPGMQDFNGLSLIVLGTTSLWAATGLMVKSLTRTEPTLRIVVFMTLFMTVFSIPYAMAIDVMRWPNLLEFKWMLAIAVSSLLAHFMQVKAYSLASVVQLMPFDFSRLLFTGFFAYLFFAETLGGNTLLGSTIILASAFFIASRDAKVRVPASIPRS